MAAVLLLLSLAIASFPSGSAETEPQVFFSDPFDDLGGWTTDPGWTVTDNRAHDGTALYFGDDRGTSDPGDNEMPCDPCSASATSPTFALPADSPAYLYFWLYGSYDDFLADGLSLSVSDDTGLVAQVLQAKPIRDGFLKVDLSPFAGSAVSLTFHLDQSWVLPWNEGAYIDSLIVTDVNVTVANELHLTGSGPAADVTFTIPEDGAKGMLTLYEEGTIAGGYGGSFTVIFRDGEIVFGFGFFGGRSPQNLDIDLLGHEIVDYNQTSPGGGGSMSGQLTMWLNEAPPGVYRVLSGAIGMTDTYSEVSLYATSALDAVQAGLGGEEIAQVWARDFHTDGVYVGQNGETTLMVDGTYSVETTGRAFGFLYAWAMVEESLITTPEGPSEARHPYQVAETGGTWTYAVDVVVDGWAVPWINLVALPELSDPIDLSAPDLSPLPGVGDGTEPGPEPEPWPAGYTVNQTQRGFVACSVGAGPAQSSDLCDRSHPDSDTVLTFPLDDGTTRITLELTSPGGPFGDAPLCATVMRPPGIHTPACTGDGPVAVWSAPEGEARTDGAEELVIDVRTARDGGLAYEQPFDLVVESEHWGGQA